MWLQNNYSNVFVLPDRIDVKWADRSVIVATLRLLEFLHKFDIHFDTFIPLSGEHYPLQTNEEILRRVKNRVAENVFSGHPHMPGYFMSDFIPIKEFPEGYWVAKVQQWCIL